MTILENIGKQIKARRRELHMTQNKLSIESGISQATISEIERGKTNVSIGVLSRLCAYLYCELDVLLKPVL